MYFDPDQTLSAQGSPANLDIVSGWRVGRKLHEGKWFSQYSAATVATEDANYDYVLKMIKPNLSYEMREQAISRLSAEAIITEQVQQRNVIPLLDAELDRAPFFLVQPLIRGASLAQLFEVKHPIPLSKILWLVRQAVEAISALHDHHRTYLGIHPSHLLVEVTGNVSLIGWGNSLINGQALETKLSDTMTEQFGLAHYAAPEMFDEQYVAIEASDVYGLGALIFHMFAGQPPFPQHDFESLKKSVLHSMHTDLQLFNRNCPGALNQLVNQMLTKCPDRRPNLQVLMDQIITLEIEYLQNATLIEF